MCVCVCVEGEGDRYIDDQWDSFPLVDNKFKSYIFYEYILSN